MPSDNSTKPLPTVVPRPGDGAPIDISELIRGGVRLSATECSQIPFRNASEISTISIEEMWDELERLLNLPEKQNSSN